VKKDSHTWRTLSGLRSGRSITTNLHAPRPTTFPPRVQYSKLTVILPWSYRLPLSNAFSTNSSRRGREDGKKMRAIPAFDDLVIAVRLRRGD
jgi:hypothetical protein